MQIDNDGIMLHVAEDGDPSAPPLLLLHGFTMSTASWDWFVPELAERFRVLRLDFRGHGGSDRAPGAYGWAAYVSDVVAVCEEVIGSPTAVIGHSLGGLAAAVVMQQRPELIAAAVLEDPPLGAPDDVVEPSAGDDHVLFAGFRTLRQSLPAAQAVGMTPEQLAGFLAQLPMSSGATMGERFTAEGIAGIATSLLLLDPSVLGPVFDPGAAGSMQLLRRDIGFPRPTLIVTADPAEPDAVTDPQVAAHFAALSPATEAMTIPGAGHAIHDEAASRPVFRGAALEFLDRVGAMA